MQKGTIEELIDKIEKTLQSNDSYSGVVGTIDSKEEEDVNNLQEINIQPREYNIMETVYSVIMAIVETGLYNDTMIHELRKPAFLEVYQNLSATVESSKNDYQHSFAEQLRKLGYSIRTLRIETRGEYDIPQISDNDAISLMSHISDAISLSYISDGDAKLLHKKIQEQLKRQDDPPILMIYLKYGIDSLNSGYSELKEFTNTTLTQ